jgi:serine/threonine protein kinase
MPGLSVNSIIGEYRITGFLGAGGMGEVYHAEHSRLGRAAAVKVLTHTTGTDGLLERFFNEARIQSSLRHPNVATLYDFTEVHGQPCIIMEYVDGQTLAERIRPSGPMPLAEIVYIFQAIVEAIAYIHDNGVVHRDIKSNNIKVSSSGEVKLLDFGIAKSEASQQLTATGSVIGTLEYLSPEQLMGGVADARADIWALGVLLYEMSVGRVPFEAITIGELCRKIQKVEYTPAAVLNPAVPREVATIINRCLRKNPTDRYRVARDLLEDTKRLRRLVTNPGLSGDLTGGGQPLNQTIRIALTSVDRRLIGIVGAGVLLVSVAVALIYLGQSSFNSRLQPSPESPAGETGTNVDPPVTDSDPSDSESRSITIDVVGGKAEVYRDGAFVCETPCPVVARIGDTLNVELKRDGFRPLTESFSVTAQTKTKTFLMQSEAADAESQ